MGVRQTDTLSSQQTYKKCQVRCRNQVVVVMEVHVCQSRAGGGVAEGIVLLCLLFELLGRVVGKVFGIWQVQFVCVVFGNYPVIFVHFSMLLSNFYTVFGEKKDF